MMPNHIREKSEAAIPTKRARKNHSIFTNVFLMTVPNIICAKIQYFF